MADDLETQLGERIAANVTTAEKAMKAAMAEPWVKGSTGQKRAHPGFDVAARCDELALRLTVELRELRHQRKRADEDERLRKSNSLTREWADGRWSYWPCDGSS